MLNGNFLERIGIVGAIVLNLENPVAVFSVGKPVSVFMYGATCTHTLSWAHDLIAKYTAWGPSFRYWAPWSHDCESQGLLFFSRSSSSFSSPRGSQCYARGSERFTFNFYFSCFGLRFTSRPEVFFYFFLLFQLSWNRNVMYSAWGVALFTMQFDTRKPCSPSVFTMHLYRWTADISAPLIQLFWL